MGNENSATTKPIPEKPCVPGSGRPNYQPPVRSRKNATYPAPIEKNPIVTDKRNYDSPTQSKGKVSEESSTPHDYQNQPSAYQPKQPTSAAPVQQSFQISDKDRLTSVAVKKSASPVVTNQQISPPVQNTSLPFKFTASNFEKAPMIQLNYVVRSSDNNSIHTYEPDNVTVMRRTSSQAVSHSNRWYDVDYNQNVKPHIVKYF